MPKKAQAVSIVIPVFNEENYIEACLESIQAQTIMPDEVVVVDNNCTDGTMEIVRRYSFVKIIKEETPGVLFARNAGIDATTGDIIGRIDADTVLRENWVAYLKDIFKDPSIAAVTGPASWYDMPLADRSEKVDIFFKYPLYKLDKDFPFLFGTNMAITKKAWQQIKPELCTSRKMHEDIDLAIHLYKNELKIVYEPKLVVSNSSRRFDDNFESFIEYIRFYEHSYKRHGMMTAGVHVAIGIYTLGYIMLWPLRQSYDEKTKTRSLRHLLAGRNKARKNPMAREHR